MNGEIVGKGETTGAGRTFVAAEHECFASFAIAMATICVLSGGITSFPQGLCASAAPAPLAGAGQLGLLFALAVALTMGRRRPLFLLPEALITGPQSWAGGPGVLRDGTVQHRRSATAIAAVNVGACQFLLKAMGRKLQFNFDDILFSYTIPAGLRDRHYWWCKRSSIIEVSGSPRGLLTSAATSS